MEVSTVDVSPPNIRTGSSNDVTVELMIELVPLTVKLPATTKLFLTVVSPVAAPILSDVAAPAKLTVVLTVFHRSTEVCVPTTVGFLKVNVPEFAPMLTVVPTPAKLTDVLTVFHRLTDACVPTTVGFLKVNIPEFAPMLTVVPAPNKLPVVAFVLKTLALPVLVVLITGEVPAAPPNSNVDVDGLNLKLADDPAVCAPDALITK